MMLVCVVAVALGTGLTNSLWLNYTVDKGKCNICVCLGNLSGVCPYRLSGECLAQATQVTVIICHCLDLNLTRISNEGNPSFITFKHTHAPSIVCPVQEQT